MLVPWRLAMDYDWPDIYEDDELIPPLDLTDDDDDEDGGVILVGEEELD